MCLPKGVHYNINSAKQQTLQAQATYHPHTNSTVWPEMRGHSQHRITGYSQIVLEAKSKQAQAVFDQAFYTLSKMKETW